MHCRQVRIGDGFAIVCTGSRPAQRCRCGQAATLQCDWKIGLGRTCDAYICDRCAQQVGPDKHLCGEHRSAYTAWLARRRATAAGTQ